MAMRKPTSVTTLMGKRKRELVQMVIDLHNTNQPTRNPEKKIIILEQFHFENSKATKYIQFGNKKFRLYYESTNGFPMGFNYKKCFAIQKEDGTWSNQLDNNKLHYKSDVSYVSSEDAKEIDARKFFRVIVEHIKKIY